MGWCLIPSGSASTLRARLILSSAVVSFHYHQEESVGDVGYFRVRCTLIDGERATA